MSIVAKSDYIDIRTIELAEYIVAHHATVRQAAAEFHISKSTVHKDLRSRLQNINADLYAQVSEILELNLRERHIRGGIATKEKYQKLRGNHQALI